MNYRTVSRFLILTGALISPICVQAEPIVPRGTLAERGQSALGLVVFTLIAFAIGRARGAKVIPWRVVGWGIVLCFVFGGLVIYQPKFLEKVQQLINNLLAFSNAGARMVFGNLIDNPVNVTSDKEGKLLTGYAQIGFVFAFSVLPTIIFIAMLTAILYHIGILTYVVHGLAWVMRKTMGTSGAETLSTAANIFVGQTEAPLIVKPFLAAATNSEMMAIMVGGFANIASGVLVVYSQLLGDFVPKAGGHLALACFISAPATLIVAKLMMPETTEPVTAGGVKFTVERIDANLIDAATRGTTEGMALCINVAAMLIAFTALVALLNGIIGGVGGWFGLPNLTMQQILGYVLAPAAWLCGVEWKYAVEGGSLLGIKTVLNEFIAYFEMSKQLKANPNCMSPRAALLLTYALCGFANFASVGIQIGGISTMAPTRRSDLSRLGLLAMVGGAISSCMGACVVGVLW